MVNIDQLLHDMENGPPLDKASAKNYKKVCEVISTNLFVCCRDFVKFQIGWYLDSL